MTKRAVRLTDPEAIKKLYETVYDKFVDKDRFGCWPWKGYADNGYGRVYCNGKKVKASRMALIIDGRDPGALMALHRCDNPECVRPDHLYPGTAKQNARDMRDNDRASFAKLTVKQVANMRLDLSRGISVERVAKKYRVSKQTVWRVRRGACWN